MVIIDFDVLFYKRPTALLDAALAADPAYSVCCCYCYSMPESDMKALIGEAPIPLFNPGVFAVDRSIIDLERWNEYLRDLHFWNPDGSGQVFCRTDSLGLRDDAPEREATTPDLCYLPSITGGL